MTITKYFVDILAKYDAEILDQYVEILGADGTCSVARDSYFLKNFTVHFNYSFHSKLVPIGNIIEELDSILFEFSHRDFSNSNLDRSYRSILLEKEELQWFEYAVQLLTNNEHYLNHVETYDGLKKLYRKLDLELKDCVVGVQSEYILPMHFDCQTLRHEYQYQYVGGFISLKLDALKLQIFGEIAKDGLSSEWLIPFDKFNFFEKANEFSHLFKKEYQKYVASKMEERMLVEKA